MRKSIRLFNSVVGGIFAVSMLVSFVLVVTAEKGTIPNQATMGLKCFWLALIGDQDANRKIEELAANQRQIVDNQRQIAANERQIVASLKRYNAELMHALEEKFGEAEEDGHEHNG
ncbi:hypothetical protein KEM56_005686 [Ascosphaera pollenicola]|nr:hypothetical protein KEM56_005686 [Ascosphaera pollenicola]